MTFSRSLSRAIALAIGLSAGPAWAEWTPLEVERVIAFGYSAIAERHLQPVTAASIALDGMRGLADLDPQLAVAVQGGAARLTSTEAVLGEHAVPPEDDAAAWAKVTMAVIAEARKSSEAIRAADDERIYQAVFEGALGKADLYSRYASAREAREHRASRNGFGGVGVKFDLVDGEPRLIEVVEETPASRAGLKAGDILISIDGQTARGLERAAVSALLRGQVGTDLRVSVRRGAEMLQATLRRSLIVPKTVTMTLSGGIAQIKVSSFNQRTAFALENALQDARTRLGPALVGVVLDLRGNPGGLLDKAVAVADLFIANGPIVTTRGRHPEAGNAFDAHSGDIGEDLPVAVLVDGRTASAAEILASSLQDSGRAVVIGSNTYGKGAVQTVIALPNDGEITLTWSRFHTPTGYALHGLGVLPAVCAATAPAPGAVAEGLVRGSQGAKLPETLAVWRHAALDEVALRQRLRDGCPPSRRTDEKADMEIAEKILLNRAAYARAIALSTPGRALEALQSRPQEAEPARR